MNMLFFGGQATTYGFCLSLLALPGVLRYDEARKESDR